jgi:hypothetical protein
MEYSGSSRRNRNLLGEYVQGAAFKLFRRQGSVLAARSISKPKSPARDVDAKKRKDLRDFRKWA